MGEMTPAPRFLQSSSSPALAKDLARCAHSFGAASPLNTLPIQQTALRNYQSPGCDVCHSHPVTRALGCLQNGDAMATQLHTEIIPRLATIAPPQIQKPGIKKKLARRI